MTFSRFITSFTKSIGGAAIAIAVLQLLGDVELPGAIKESWRYAWHEIARESDTVAFVVLLNAWGILVYWVFGAMYALLDFKVIDAIRYKTQPTRNVPPISREVFFKAVRGVLLNQFVVGVAFSFVCMPLLRLRGISYDPEETPTKLSDFAKHLVGYAVCEEIFFYTSHRLFHEVPYLYKRFHKQHHEYVAPIAIAARYAHPFEDVLANVWPVMSGPLFCGSHITFFFLWIALALFSTEGGHSGFHLPFMPPNEFHDFHHLAFSCNYGAMKWLDALFDTDAKYNECPESQRNIFLWGTESARERFPDKEKRKAPEAKGD